MRSYVKMLAIPALVLSAACSSNDDSRVDEALRSDLALAATAQPYQPQQFVSPMEQGYMQNGYAQPQQMYGGAYGQPVYQQAPQPVRTVYRTAPRTTSTASRTTTAREPVIVRRNTKRDAIIGATAGAVIGATTSRDRVKGAVIGGAAGAVLGGIIGHTVDVERQ